MKRVVVLVALNWTRDKDPRIPLGHASILAALKRSARVNVRSVVIPVNLGALDPLRVARQIVHEVGTHPHHDVDIAIGAYVWGEDLLQQVLPLIRSEGFQGRLILGGPQISYSGPGLESVYPDVDAFVRGYGEMALCQMVEQPFERSIPGVHWAGEVDRREQAEVDLQALPSPWLASDVVVDRMPFLRWETQRGCPYRCAFCQHREPGARLKRRALERTRVEQEVDLFCASGVKDIAVLDPIFNASPDANAILERFVHFNFSGRLSLQCRAESVSDRFLDLAQQLNVRLEFGVQTIHRNEDRAIRRQNNIPKVEAVLAKVRERNIAHEVSIIFGLPNQTLNSFKETIAWCLAHDVPVIKAFPLMILRGTELEDQREVWGIEDSGGGMPLVYQSHSFSFEEWSEMARLSEALSITEGKHPKDLSDLLDIAAPLQPDLLRWAPASQQAAE